MTEPTNRQLFEFAKRRRNEARKEMTLATGPEEYYEFEERFRFWERQVNTLLPVDFEMPPEDLWGRPAGTQNA